ncbi:digestive organ expansion factor [Clavulina sp. PMI_390]|nr:digestive organ expansion factor [Clavulina sp. PMI_390]
MDSDSHNDTKTKLLTLLNVSHLKSSKRKRDFTASLGGPEKRVKLNQKRVQKVEPKSVLPADTSSETPEESNGGLEIEEEAIGEDGDEDALEDEDENDAFKRHFGPKTPLLTPELRKKADAGMWEVTAPRGKSFGGTRLVHHDVQPHSLNDSSPKIQKLLAPKLVPVHRALRKSIPSGSLNNWDPLIEDLLTARDIYLPHVKLADHTNIRKVMSLGVLNHILKIRRTILKNNDRIAAATSKGQEPPEDVRDQGYTRPSILVLLPFRNSALSFVQSFLDHFTSSLSHLENPSKEQKSQEAQIHHYARFVSQYSLPDGAVDKLVSAEPGTYPPDHVQTFSGNIDDNFRIGVKLTKRSVRLFEAFYGADMIVASPLGLRMAIEKEGNADFLSSIEIVIVDQVDAILMQNWEHVQFIFQRMNKIPKDSHGADFSRIKPWYLDEQASYLRQTILLSQYDTPEARSLFKSLKNIEGKVHSSTSWDSLDVPEGIDQRFIKFEAANPKEDPEKRFDHFTKKLFPSILRSAVQSSGTVIFVSSYFDFVRVQNWLKKDGASCAFLSEYSTPQDISRARQAFFSGSKQFLVITERFHFFRRYRLRGVRNIIFYQLPSHGQFYAEFLGFPFLDDGVEPSDVQVQVLYSKYDLLRLERIVGTESATRLVE